MEDNGVPVNYHPITSITGYFLTCPGKIWTRVVVRDSMQWVYKYMTSAQFFLVLPFTLRSSSLTFCDLYCLSLSLFMTYMFSYLFNFSRLSYCPFNCSFSFFLFTLTRLFCILVVLSVCVLYSSYCHILRGGGGGGGGGETVSKLFIELELFLILILADSFSLSFSEVSALSHRMTWALFHFCIVLLSLLLSLSLWYLCGV